MISLIDATGELLARFHAGLYWDAFATAHEPLETWQRAVRGELAYELTVRLALDGDAIAGGICFERYPHSGVGFATYLVVAPAARGRGLGERLLRDAVADLTARGAPVVLGEVRDPRALALFRGWGARVLDVVYVQPALGDGLARARDLALIALPPAPSQLPGALVRAFVEELYGVTEGGPPDPEVAIPDRVQLR